MGERSKGCYEKVRIIFASLQREPQPFIGVGPGLCRMLDTDFLCSSLT